MLRSPAARALASGLAYAALLGALFGVAFGLGALADYWRAPWLPYVAVVVVSATAIGALTYVRERQRRARER